MFKNKIQNNKAFTLIELLVVISIIGLLSTVVLASLNTARAKARDAAIRSGFMEYRKLLALEYSDNGSYNGLQNGQWIPNSGVNAKTCDTMTLSGNYVSQARAICNSIYKNISSTSVNRLYFGAYPSNVTRYSMMAVLSNNKHICVGISGTSDSVNYWESNIHTAAGGGPENVASAGAGPAHYSEAPIGCYYNP